MPHPTVQPFGARHYASFGENGFWLPELSKINVFIGKNNTGKTNVLKFINDVSSYVKNPDKSHLMDTENRHWDRTQRPQVVVNRTLEDLQIQASHFSGIVHGGELEKLLKVNHQFIYDLQQRRIVLPNTVADNPATKTMLQRLFGLSHDARNWENILNDRFAGNVSPAISGLFPEVFSVPQFREFRYDGAAAAAEEKPGKYDDYRNAAGYRLAARLAWMKSPGVKHNAEQIRFRQIEESVRDLLELPNLKIDFEEAGGDRPRAVILDVNGLRRYLESYGTGIHQLVILCFALSLKRQTVVCVEEPENFLHPGLQKRFYEFLRTTDNTYFITTHSNVILDSAKYDDTRVYHVTYDNAASQVRQVEATTDAYRVLDDMGFHASDIMQSNGVVWVEGPTDRLFFLKWLDLRRSSLQEGVHFSVMFYGGKLLSHLAFEPELDSCGGFIPLLRLNRNAIVIMDSDRVGKRKRMPAWRKRLVTRLRGELQRTGGVLWITRGREVENYLAKTTLKKFCSAKWNTDYSLNYGYYTTLDEMIRHGSSTKKEFRYGDDKVKYCREILPHMSEDDLSVLYLKNDLSTAIAAIERWNPKMTGPSS